MNWILTPKNNFGFLRAVDNASDWVDPSMSGWNHRSNFDPKAQFIRHKSTNNFIVKTNFYSSGYKNMICISVSVKLNKKVGKKVKVLMLAVRLVYNCICCSLDCTNFFTRKMKVVDRGPIQEKIDSISFHWNLSTSWIRKVTPRSAIIQSKRCRWCVSCRCYSNCAGIPIVENESWFNFGIFFGHFDICKLQKTPKQLMCKCCCDKLQILFTWLSSCNFDNERDLVFLLWWGFSTFWDGLIILDDKLNPSIGELLSKDLFFLEQVVVIAFTL